MNQNPKNMTDEQLEQFKSDQNAKLQEQSVEEAQSLTINCMSIPQDTISFGLVDKIGEMTIKASYNGEVGEYHIGNVEASAIIFHLREQFQL